MQTGISGGTPRSSRPSQTAPKPLEVPQESRPVARIEAVPPSTTQLIHHTIQPSVEISRNGKGEASWSLKLGSEGETIEAIVDRLVKIDVDLKKRLRGEGGG